MAWFSTTRWLNNSDITLDESINLLMTDHKGLRNDGSIQYTNLQKHKLFDQNLEIKIENRDIKYNVIDFSMNYTMPGMTKMDEQTSIIRGMIIVYTDGAKTQYIINRNSDALKLLRRLHGYTGRNEIVENKFTFSDDIFMWFVKTVFTKDNEFLFTDAQQNEKSLTINSIIGVRGETKDDNTLSAHGDTVLKLISTLSFILESNLLKQIILRLEYTGHENMELKLNDKGVVSVDIDSYSGNYEDSEENKKKAQLLLLVYLDILPKLTKIYYDEQSDGNWNIVEKNNFFELIENNLFDRLKTRKEQVREEQVEVFSDEEKKEQQVG
ncbi:MULTISPECIES: hypothetical protein [unclassified Enterococcus]|uniref:hypothetical protein n=2 Tax=Enterococcus TaxID=1350 RepID=UPI0028FD0E1A|nr:MULTISPECIES: hypothetical protein [unclassified Enterococcus]MDU0318789.1 hypothetical protein [Enterococcus sp. 2STP]MDU0350577.1 hypothetical protein [Enterococcus sp. 3MOLP]